MDAHAAGADSIVAWGDGTPTRDRDLRPPFKPDLPIRVQNVFGMRLSDVAQTRGLDRVSDANKTRPELLREIGKLAAYLPEILNANDPALLAADLGLFKWGCTTHPPSA